jgi:ADP-heptose:LPS heptosyltransferase
MFSFEKYASAIYSLPYKGIPSNWRQVWEEKGLLKSAWRRVKRDLMLLCTGQNFLLRKQIPDSAKKILVIYRARPQLGDSIQELSGRQYLQAENRTIHLLTDKPIADIYEGDKIFDKVFSDPGATAKDYDFVILMSLSWKNMGIKFRHFPRTHFSVVYGYSHGIELNQLMLSCAAFSQFNNRPVPSSCRPIFNLKYIHEHIERESNSIAIAVGGLGKDRIYPHWPQVVDLLINYFETQGRVKDFKIYLIGSSNGRSDADKILAQVRNPEAIQDLVGKTSLGDCFLLLKKVRLLICADGGLMHLAACSSTPLVSLFANIMHPLFRLQKDYPAVAIHANFEVSRIPPELIFSTFTQMIEIHAEGLKTIFLDSEPVFH